MTILIPTSPHSVITRTSTPGTPTQAIVHQYGEMIGTIAHTPDGWKALTPIVCPGEYIPTHTTMRDAVRYLEDRHLENEAINALEPGETFEDVWPTDWDAEYAEAARRNDAYEAALA